MVLNVDRWNVGRMAERIVANELEYRGYRVNDLNKEGVSANADLIAANEDGTIQVQVKGATNQPKHLPKERWWVQYGHCTDAIIHDGERMFNRRKSFYSADLVILVAVRSPIEYRCVVLPTKKAEEVAQLNIDRAYRTLTKAGEKKVANKVWSYLESSPREKGGTGKMGKLLLQERAVLNAHANWDALDKIVHRKAL